MLSGNNPGKISQIVHNHTYEDVIVTFLLCL